MTIETLIEKLQELSEKWDAGWHYGDHGGIWFDNSAEDCAEQLNELISQAQQPPTDTTP